MAYCLSAIVISAYLLAGCNSSLDSDAKQLAELQCRARRAADRVTRGQASAGEEADSLMRQMGKLRYTFDTKYPLGFARDEFTKAYLEALAKCKTHHSHH